MNELAQSIYNDFQRRYLSDWWAQRVIQEGKAASMDDIAKLAHDLGYHLMAAVRWHIEDADLPSGEEMTALAHEILDPLLHDSYDMINAAADDLVKRLDAFRGVGISPRHADYPTERVDTICRSAGEEGKSRETITRRMSNVAETVVNSFSDRYMETNAALYSSAGFETYIERTDDGKCCPWCSKMAGRYEYPDKTPKDVFRRHDNCGCRVVWVCGNMRQDVHSKETWEQPNVTEPELVRNPDVTVPELTKNPDVKVPELTSGLLTEGRKSGIMGLGAGTGNTYVQDHKKPDFLKNINFDDDKAVQIVLSEFEKFAADSDIEMACVIAKNGSVYYCYGIKDAVYPDSDLGDLIKGAVISHNHVRSETSFSFGGDDFATFQNNDLKMLIGFDYKYRYILDKNASLIDDIPDDWQTFENFQHTSNIYTAQMRGYGYRRVRI